MRSSLQKEFEKVRNEMEELGRQLGLVHPEVFAISQRLDSIHNQILRESKCS